MIDLGESGKIGAAGEPWNDPELGVSKPYHLPMYEAWRDPVSWLMSHNGLINDKMDKIAIPVDKQGFVDVEAYLEKVFEEVLQRDYKWKYDPQDPTTRLVPHEWYFTPVKKHDYRTFGKDPLPSTFSRLQGNSVWLPWRFRNALQGVSERMQLPSREGMMGAVASQEWFEANVPHVPARDVISEYFPGYLKALDQVEITDSQKTAA